MRHQPNTLLSLLFCLLTLFYVQPAAADANLVSQTWQLLDYMASDYAEAVSDGEVIDDDEYAEQLEFAGVVKHNLGELPEHDMRQTLVDEAQQLINVIEAKETNEVVSGQAHKVADLLLDTFPVPTSPTVQPDLNHGATLYQTYCASCHGATGDADGPAADGLDPEPIAFTDAARADKRSPLSYYQTTTQGVDGTSMASFGEQLSDDDRWALAYFVATLPYQDKIDQGKQIWQTDLSARAQISNLDELSRTRGEQLDSVLGLDNTRAVLGYLRANSDALDTALTNLPLARGRLAASLKAYKAGDVKDAVQLALSSYLDGVEPVEPLIDSQNRKLRSQIELQMGVYRTQISRQLNYNEVAAQAEVVDQLLAEADELLEGSTATPSTTFLGAFVILLREGLEALLIVIGLIAFLKKAKREETLPYVHAGWVIALVAGGLTWFVARYFIEVSGASRELTEGLSSLFAAAVLLGVGLWMHQKSMGDRWQTYIKEKMGAALTKKSAWLLFVLTFVTVYREIFETILFYIALWQPGMGGWMLLGILAAVACLVVIAWIMLATSRKLPLSTFFSASSALIAVLVFVMVGKGVSALQEAGWVSVTLAPTPHIDWLGMSPTWQTTSAQIAIVLVMLLGYLYNKTKAKR